MKDSQSSNNQGGQKPQRIFQSKDYEKREIRHRDSRPVAVERAPLSPDVPESFEGMYIVGKNGLGSVTHKDTKSVVIIESHHANTALNKDTVMVSIIDRPGGLGAITEVLRRAKAAYTGIVEERGGILGIVPTEHKDPEMRLVDTDMALVGTKVAAVIDHWENGQPIGKIQTVIGKPGENETEMVALALERGFSAGFPAEVMAEAEKLRGYVIPEEEIAKRRDMRKVLTFTIDPIDAKDFDDALSFQVLPDGKYEIGIHIADVSHFVTPMSELDNEARRRTTSVYLVDRVIPMLPEILSNHLCSIRQDEEKLAFSTIYHIEPKTGAITDTWFGRTVIHSDKRFSYEEAQAILDAGEGLYYTELSEFNRLAKIYTQQRFARGALDMDQDEVRFVLDEAGKPIRVTIKQRIQTNRLIEEFMLLANRSVAERLSKKDAAGIAVYRVHDLPSVERMEELQRFLKVLGYQTTMKDGVIPPEQLQKVLSEAGTDAARETIQTSIIRSLAKAIYSTQNIGHYGLAFQYYTHFTSPIRRYPDVMVHRLLQMTLDGKQASPDEFADIMRMARFSSDRERDAQEAERASIKYKQVEYMTERIGQEFVGVVSGASKFGLYVAEAESKSEGMIRLPDLGDDYYEFDDKQGAIIGRRTGETFRIGDRLRVRVKDADLNRRVIDYIRITDTK
jgi:ribonuclease R